MQDVQQRNERSTPQPVVLVRVSPRVVDLALAEAEAPSFLPHGHNKSQQKEAKRGEETERVRGRNRNEHQTIKTSINYTTKHQPTENTKNRNIKHTKHTKQHTIQKKNIEPRDRYIDRQTAYSRQQTG